MSAPDDSYVRSISVDGVDSPRASRLTLRERETQTLNLRLITP